MKKIVWLEGTATVMGSLEVKALHETRPLTVPKDALLVQFSLSEQEIQKALFWLSAGTPVFI